MIARRGDELTCGAPAKAPQASIDADQGEEPWQVRVDGENDRSIVILVLLVLVLAFLFEVTPAQDGITIFGGDKLPEVCGMKLMGWGECPGCGLTRSFVLALRLDPAAFRLHPAGPLLLLVFLGQLPYRGYRCCRRRTLARQGLVDLRWDPLGRWGKAFWWGLPALVVAGWLIKLTWS